MLERGYPEYFARPEIQLAVQTNVMTNGNGGGSGLALESVVVTDLEFLGLAKKDGYQHRPEETASEGSRCHSQPGEDPELYGSIKPWSKIFELLALLLECGVSGPEAVAEPGWHRLVAAGGLVDNCPRHRLPIHSPLRSTERDERTFDRFVPMSCTL